MIVVLFICHVIVMGLLMWLSDEKQCGKLAHNFITGEMMVRSLTGYDTVATQSITV